MKIWKTYVPWTKDFVKDNINIIERNYRDYPFQNRWSADGTNVHTGHSDDEDRRRYINYYFLGKEYEKIVERFCKENNVKQHYRIGDIWYNYYRGGQYQTPHTHEGDFTAVHYLKFNRFKHSTTKFVDPTIRMPFIREGTLIIFPATYAHYVKPQKSEDSRLTIAFGFLSQQI